VSNSDGVIGPPSVERDDARASGSLLPGRRRDADSRWFVLRTRSRQEKALESSMRCAGIDCHLPLRRGARRRDGRRAESLVPMFPGYLFLWGVREDVFFADRTRRVAGVIPVTDQATLEWELAAVHRAFVAGAVLDPYDAIREGLRVRVVSGPFEGLEGVVESRVSPERLVLQVRMLSTAASLDIRGDLVEAI
jgi:transcription antitermination factor NusG